MVLQQGLLITVIGMGLVFAVIILLWGLMAIMMRLTSREDPNLDNAKDNPLIDEDVIPEMGLVERQRQAAAAAVAVDMVIAANKAGVVRKGVGYHESDLTPWQTVHRLRQLDPRKRRE
jgi:Na+-transporting methylmalonyl-CoA/oxaloacetate decarboxylase gamma subunit